MSSLVDLSFKSWLDVAFFTLRYALSILETPKGVLLQKVNTRLNDP